MRLLKPKSKKTDKLHLNLQWLCENHGKPEWERLIVNQILTDLEEYPLDDETVFDLIDYDLKSQSAVLTARGVFYWLDILTGFFDKEDLLDVARYMKETERNNREHYYNQMADYILTWSKISVPHLNRVIKRDKKFKADLLKFLDYGQKFETEIACKVAPGTVEI